MRLWHWQLMKTEKTALDALFLKVVAYIVDAGARPLSKNTHKICGWWYVLGNSFQTL